MNRLKPYVKPGFIGCLEVQMHDLILSGSGPGAASEGDFPGVQRGRSGSAFDDEFPGDDGSGE